MSPTREIKQKKLLSKNKVFIPLSLHTIGDCIIGKEVILRKPLILRSSAECSIWRITLVILCCGEWKKKQFKVSLIAIMQGKKGTQLVVVGQPPAFHFLVQNT